MVVRIPPRGTVGSCWRLCGSEEVAALEESALCPRTGAARRPAHGGRLLATGFQGDLRTLHDGVGRGCGLGRHGRRVQGGPRGGPQRDRSAVAHRADGCLFLWPPLATARPAPPQSREGAARSRWWTRKRSADLEEGDEAFELWILLAIALLTAVAAAYSLLTATGVLGGG